jgi:protein arginine kinase activator
MQCERCNEHPAKVKFIEIEGGVKRSRWLCEACAAAEGAAQPTPTPPAVSLDASLQAFLGGVAPPVDDQPATAPCPACGITLQQLRETGLLGCSRCYPHFRTYLLPLLNRYHRTATHLGKAPRARGPRAARRLELARLRSALEAAVAAEDFEEAARLRDLIAEQQAQLDAAARSEHEEGNDVPGR